MECSVRATTRSGYVISYDVIGPDRNQNIDLTAEGLSSTEMSKKRALWLGCSLKKSNGMNTNPINLDDFMRLSVRFTNIKMIIIEEDSVKTPGLLISRDPKQLDDTDRKGRVGNLNT